MITESDVDAPSEEEQVAARVEFLENVLAYYQQVENHAAFEGAEIGRSRAY